MLSELFGIKKADVISVVGAGGKSTLIRNLSKELYNNKILVTTSTKIYYPSVAEYDFINIGRDGLFRFIESQNKGIYILGDYINGQNKICGFDSHTLDRICDDFDICLVESDGAKEKLLKAWNNTEPVIIANTTKTIGVVNLGLLRHRLNDDNVHRAEIFAEITGARIGDFISLGTIKKMIIHNNGLFKNARGEKILYINRLDTSQDWLEAKALLELFNKEELEKFDKIIGGSLVTNDFMRFYPKVY